MCISFISDLQRYGNHQGYSCLWIFMFTVFTHFWVLKSLYYSQLSFLKGDEKEEDEVIDVDELDNRRKEWGEVDDRKMREPQWRVLLARELPDRWIRVFDICAMILRIRSSRYLLPSSISLHWMSRWPTFDILHIIVTATCIYYSTTNNIQLNYEFNSVEHNTTYHNMISHSIAWHNITYHDEK